MTVQPTRPPDMEILQDLEMEVAIPCEVLAAFHEENGSGPADFIIDLRCPRCGKSDKFFICQGCLTFTMQGGNLLCTVCHANTIPILWLYTIAPIKGGG